jgi:hypothetical protein
MDDRAIDSLNVIIRVEELPKLLVDDYPLREITEQDLDNFLLLRKTHLKDRQNYPDFDFKMNLSGLAPAEKDAAIQWLKEVAESRGINYDYIDTSKYIVNYVWVRNLLCSPDDHIESYDSSVRSGPYRHVTLPELTLAFATSVTSWKNLSAPDPKVLQLEGLVDELAKQLKNVENELKQLKKVGTVKQQTKRNM